MECSDNKAPRLDGCKYLYAKMLMKVIAYLDFMSISTCSSSNEFKFNDCITGKQTRIQSDRNPQICYEI